MTWNSHGEKTSDLRALPPRLTVRLPVTVANEYVKRRRVNVAPTGDTTGKHETENENDPTANSRRLKKGLTRKTGHLQGPVGELRRRTCRRRPPAATEGGTREHDVMAWNEVRDGREVPEAYRRDPDLVGGRYGSPHRGWTSCTAVVRLYLDTV